MLEMMLMIECLVNLNFDVAHVNEAKNKSCDDLEVTVYGHEESDCVSDDAESGEKKAD